MKNQRASLFVAALTAAVLWTPVSASQKPQRAPAAPQAARRADQVAEPRLIPLDIQIVVSRYRGEKKVSSVPFSLAVNANDPEVSQLRMGANVPVPSLVAPKGNASGQTGPLPGPVSYRDIGTAIDCNARALDDGRFQLFLSVEDSSVYTDVQDGATLAANDMPVFRTFKSKNTLVLRDGQTRQFTAATDRVNGEVVKVDVTLKLVK